MSVFIDMPLGDAQERKTLEEGTYLARIEDADFKESKKTPGRYDIMVRVSFPEEPMAKNVFHHIIGVTPDDDPEKRNNKLCQAKAFLDLFEVEYDPASGFELDAMLGCEAKVNVRTEEYQGQLNNRLTIDW